MNKITGEVEVAPWRFDPAKFGPVLTAVWSSLHERLGDGGWHPLAAVRAEIVAEGANRKTVDELIRKGRQEKYIAWRGGYSPKTQRDTREIRLSP